MKKCYVYVLLAALLLSGCGTVTPTEPTATTAPEPTQESTAATTVPTAPTHPGPLLVMDYLDSDFANYDAIKEYTVLIPKDGVLILTDEESLEKTFVEGDVYITYTADVSFRDVHVRGKVYCHGILRRSGYSVYTVCSYCTKGTSTKICSAFDGSHGQVITESRSIGCSDWVGNDVLDYAFETWGNYGLANEPVDLAVSQKRADPQVVQHGDRDAYIFIGQGLLHDEIIRGDVYITSGAVVEFEDVQVHGNIYCYGQLKLSNDEAYRLHDDLTQNNRADALYAYSFNESCDSFDGVHGLVVGGPITCSKIEISDDALDYAFQTWGKQ